MNLMLVVLFVSVGVGLLLPRFRGREHLLLAGAATAMTGLYYFFYRFM